MATLREQLAAAQLLQQQRQLELADAQQRLAAATPLPFPSPLMMPQSPAPTRPAPAPAPTVMPSPTPQAKQQLAVLRPSTLRDAGRRLNSAPGFMFDDYRPTTTITSGVRG